MLCVVRHVYGLDFASALVGSTGKHRTARCFYWSDSGKLQREKMGRKDLVGSLLAKDIRLRGFFVVCITEI